MTITFIRFLGCLAVIALLETHGFALTLSDFGNLSAQSPSFQGSWKAASVDQFVQDTGFISITAVSSGNPRDDGLVQVAPGTFSIAGLNQVTLTARIDLNNAAPTIAIEFLDSSFTNIRSATFSISGFTSAGFTTLTANLTANNNFLNNSVIAWRITGSNPSGDNNFRMSFDNLAIVPEPTSLMLMAVVGGGAAFARRRVWR